MGFGEKSKKKWATRKTRRRQKDNIEIGFEERGW
jgi:hypothetical protein